jgi:NAD(P)-dependent dehydrogenase (short-subunit alcohol dehydrogenase family)
LETARVLGAHGARVNPGRTGSGQARRGGALGPGCFTGSRADLADLSSVRAGAKQVAETETADLLINNAGVMNLPQRQTMRDGFETTFGTNHLGHFAFDAQVWPAVRRPLAALVVTVNAIAARWRREDRTTS